MTTITINRATVEQALEALKKNTKHLPVDFDYHFEALAALRAALAQQRLTDVQQEMERSIESLKAALAQQAEPVEPVAIADGTFNHDCPIGTLLYTAPPQRKPLTVEEIERVWRDGGWAGRPSIGVVRAVERALEEKNRGR